MIEIETGTSLRSIDAFKGLAADDLALLESGLRQMHVARGEALVRQGGEADALFIIISGRFEVTVSGRANPVAEIGPGQPVGEIAFLAGGKRTATVTALRDSLVLMLGREEFDALAKRNPAIWRSMTVALAQRLADTNLGRANPPDPKPRTITIIPAGSQPVPKDFLSRLVRKFQAHSRVLLIDGANVGALLGTRDPGSSDATQALNALEMQHDYVIYLSDADLTRWSEKAIRQADLVLSVGVHDNASGTSVAPSPIERFAAAMHAPGSQRLVLLHERAGRITGTAHWLRERRVSMHHHVALDGDAGIDRLYRFIDGTAVGLVACGGGAYCSAHVGLYKACREAGVEFDIVGGTSGGSAMAAAFAMGVAPDDIDAATHEIFVSAKAMRRYTWPRYGLLDHTHYDAQLRKHFGGQAIEDLWIPYFAVSTNLSSRLLHQHRAGELWSAVRASGSIPGLLPPYFTSEGEMLVDGALVDNVPIGVMHEIKSGPNVVISFETPSVERFEIAYDSLPGRRELLRKLCNPFNRVDLPAAPGPGSVLMRSMMANRRDFEHLLGNQDVLLVPPLPVDMGILDWHRHRELMDVAHGWGVREIQRLRSLATPPAAFTIRRSSQAPV